MSTIAPCLWFNGAAEDAVHAYADVFGDVVIHATSRYGEGMPFPAGTALVVDFSIAGRRMQALNGGPMFVLNPSVSFFLHAASVDEAKRLFDGLAPGGKVRMPLGAYPWSPSYAWLEDRFGVSWQIIAERPSATGARIVPCLMFTGDNQGRAASAIAHFRKVFPASQLLSVERYAAGEGPETSVKHAKFTLGGDEFVAMDAPGPHAFTFSEALSLSVRCDDQARVDELWEHLCDGGAPGRCGWLKDRFGLSWQIVPEALVRMQTQGDGAARARMFGAMMTMSKLDVAALERAFAGAS